jgi:hypothetical protein
MLVCSTWRYELQEPCVQYTKGPWLSRCIEKPVGRFTSVSCHVGCQGLGVG